VDLCAVLPSLIVVMLLPDSGAATNLRLVRVLRLLRVFRVLHFVGLSDEAEALRAAFWASRRKIGVFLYMILTIVTVMGTIVYVVEDNTHSGFTSIPRSIYWAIVTVTTVGYGDIVPQTVSGQTIASIMMILGYAILAVPTGIVVADLQMRGRPPSSKRTMRARGLSRELRAVDTLACTTCESVAHDADASFCKNCGAELCV
jgi:voltage-gated potassium channel